MNLPEKTYHSGWPDILHSEEGSGKRRKVVQYARIRDGLPQGEFGGAACLYAQIRPKGMLAKKYQFIPTAWTDSENPVTMSGGPWIPSGRLVLYGQPPLELPPEPVKPPET